MENFSQESSEDKTARLKGVIQYENNHFILKMKCRISTNIAVNDKVWPDFDVRRMSNWGMEYMPLKRPPLGWCGRNMKAISYMLNPLGSRTKYKSYILHTSAVMYTFQKHNCKWQSMTWPWPGQKVKLRKGWVLLKGLTLRYMWAKY